MEFCKCICRNSATKEGNKALIAWQRLRDCLPLTEVRLDENKKRNRDMKNGLLSLTFIACLASSLAFADNPADAPLVTDDRNTTTTRPQNCNGFKSHNILVKTSQPHSRGSRRTDGETNTMHRVLSLTTGQS